MKNIHIEGRRWRDKVNGNTYHSARVFVDGELAAVAPFQYGYGDQYQWTGWAALVKARNLKTDKQPESPFRWCDLNGVKYSADYMDTLKRNVIAWGSL